MTAPSVKPVAQVSAVKPAAKPSLADLINHWAAGCTAAFAPKPSEVSALAWMRNTKVPELIAALAKAGYK
jgi:hypothetical protein